MDKQKFGAFVAALRKEKGLTQKELAEQLYISDKAVSKWETAASVPGIDLLIPLSELLGVTATELLLGERMAQDDRLSVAQAEQAVQTAISCSAEEQTRAERATDYTWRWIFALALTAACAGTLFLYAQERATVGLIVSVLLGGIFGLYFCCFAKTKLPDYYDENCISMFADGPFTIQLTGLSLNNGNWKRLLNVWRVWAVALLLGYPIVCCVETSLFAGTAQSIVDSLLVLGCNLGGFFLPTYYVGKKYE